MLFQGTLISSEKITFEEHQQWFEKKLKDKNSLFLILQFFGNDAGVVRFQIKENHAIIGISISKDFRGKKLAASFLSKSAKYYFKQNSLPILAYVKPSNIASARSFEKAGFKFFKEEIFNEFSSVVYKLTRNDSIT